MDNYKLIDRFPKGEIKIPPSKSMSHRAVICAALAEGTSKISNIKLSQDIAATVDCLKALGMKFVYEGETLTVTGGLKSGIESILDCGESGTTLRLLIPIVAAIGGNYRFTGRGRLLERPLNVYEDIFRNTATKMEKTNDFINISGSLRAGTYEIEGGVSSQFIAGMLLALSILEADSEIIVTSTLESAAYVDMTIAMMANYGVMIENDCYKRFIIKGGQKYCACDHVVEGDYSQAAFFLVAEAISQGRNIECTGLNPHSLQGDKAILELLKRCNANVVTNEAGDIRLLPSVLKGGEFDVSQIPDLVPPLSVLLCFCQGKSRIYNAKRLRIKECDRLKAMATELSNLGASIIEGEDFLEIEGIDYLSGGKASSWNDHRIAMAVAVAAIRCKEDVFLSGSDSVKKSYTDFWEDFGKSGREAVN